MISDKYLLRHILLYLKPKDKISCFKTSKLFHLFTNTEKYFIKMEYFEDKSIEYCVKYNEIIPLKKKFTGQYIVNFINCIKIALYKKNKKIINFLISKSKIKNYHWIDIFINSNFDYELLEHTAELLKKNNFASYDINISDDALQNIKFKIFKLLLNNNLLLRDSINTLFMRRCAYFRRLDIIFYLLTTNRLRNSLRILTITNLHNIIIKSLFRNTNNCLTDYNILFYGNLPFYLIYKTNSQKFLPYCYIHTIISSILYFNFFNLC